MRRLVSAFRALTAAAAVLGLAAPVLGQDGTGPFARFEAAKQREEAALSASARSYAAMIAAESGAEAAAGRGLAAREAQVAQLGELEGRIARALDRLIGPGGTSPRLETELAVLEEWYGNLQRVAGNLTERSFLGLETELDGLAGAGLANPRRASFRRLRDVRAAIQAVQDEIAALRRADAAAAATARADAERLIAQRDALLARIAADTPEPLAAASRWMSAAGAAGRDAIALREAQDAVHEAYRQAIEASKRLRPPSLVDVAVSGPGGQIYSGGWTAPAGGTAQERESAQQRAELRQRRGELLSKLSRAQTLRLRLGGERLVFGEQMMSRSQALERSAARYAQLREKAVIVQALTEVAVTGAEIALTGGAATLARMTAQQLAERAGARATARGVLDNLTPLEREVVREVARRGDGRADALRIAADRAQRVLMERAPVLRFKLMSDGVPSDVAARLVEEMIAGTVLRLKNVERLNDLGNRAAADMLTLPGKLDEIGRTLPGLSEPGRLRNLAAAPAGVYGANAASLAAGKLGGLLPGDPRLAQLQGVSLTAETAVGEAIEQGANVAINTAMARTSQALSRTARLNDKFWSGMSQNAGSLGIGIVGSAVEIAVAARFDQLIDGEQKRFAALMKELDYINEMYRAELGKDFELANSQADIAGGIAAADAALAVLDGGLTRKTAVTRPAKAEGQIVVELGFTAPLLAPPVVRVGAQSLTMTPAGSGGTRWRGTVSGQALGPGEHRLDVSLAPSASAAGGLDANPATAPVRQFGGQNWQGFEEGPDRSHGFRLQQGDACTPPIAPPMLATCQRVAFLLGRWTTRRQGGTIEVRLEVDGTVSARIVEANRRMTDQGYAAGMQILRGLKPSLQASHSTWLASASDGEVFMAWTDSQPVAWIKSGVIYVEKAKPDELDWSAIGWRFSNYDPWVRVGPAPSAGR